MESLTNKTIGVIGFGNFGKVICKYLFPENKIIVFSNHLENTELPKNCRASDSLEELIENVDIIIPAVPIKKFEEIIFAISNKIKSGKIVIDICSVMEYPAEIMKKNLASKAYLLSSHPMFGPNSIQKNNDSLNGLKIVLSNISLNKNVYDLLKNHFEKLNLEIIEISPEEHDELSAKSQFFALAIGQMAQDLNLKKTQIDTPGANAIFESLSFMGKDREIIEDMITYNRFCTKIHKDMIDVLKGLKND